MATKIEKIFIVNLTVCSNCQINGEDWVSVVRAFTYYLDAIKSSQKSYFKTQNDLLILMDKDISKEMTNNILTLSCLGGRFTSAAILCHSVHFWVFLSKIVKYILWFFQLFFSFFNSLYQELSGCVSQISLVIHTFPPEVQEHSPFCSFVPFYLLNQISIIGPSWKTGQKFHWGTYGHPNSTDYE